jgi:hypothetical protein
MILLTSRSNSQLTTLRVGAQCIAPMMGPTRCDALTLALSHVDGRGVEQRIRFQKKYQKRIKRILDHLLALV